MDEKIIIELSDTPWEAACKIINATYKTTNCLNQEIECRIFDLSDLKRIGEHIVNYCNSEMRSE